MSMKKKVGFPQAFARLECYRKQRRLGLEGGNVVEKKEVDGRS
jgi:hypothetical protein